MVGELMERVGKWLPGDLTGREEIEGALRETRWVSELDRSTRRELIDELAKARDPDTGFIDRTEMRQMSIMGQEGSRQAVLRAADGTVVGERENVETRFEDGEVIAENTRTGTTKSLGERDMVPWDSDTGQVRGSDGTFLGKADNIEVSVTDDGRVLGRNVNTGTKKELTDDAAEGWSEE